MKYRVELERFARGEDFRALFGWVWKARVFVYDEGRDRFMYPANVMRNHDVPMRLWVPTARARTREQAEAKAERIINELENIQEPEIYSYVVER